MIVFGIVLLALGLICGILGKKKAGKSKHTVAPTQAELSSPRVLITYAAASGEVTQREITMRKATGHMVGTKTVLTHVNAYCHLRNTPRTFSIKRIRQAADAQTGEIIPDISTYILNASGNWQPQE
jgi:predicted DNA-binding transcriptional regulator YafY